MISLKRLAPQLTLNQLTVAAIILCFPAFLINLGSIPFIGDEAIRTLVALEMKLSGNFLVPTLNGEAYYNKPPLYNWFIYGVSQLLGYFGEWPTRLTTIIFMGLFGYTVYYFTKKNLDKLTAVTMAFMLLTSGRILFWDSMLGLIDICFSFIIYLNFMLLYELGMKGRWKYFFIASYLLFAIAFLLKGIPAIVFQALSVTSALLFHGHLRKKFISADHLLGIGAALMLLLAYYIPYARQVPIEKVFSILFDQSMQRTGTNHGILKTIQHIFTFPFEQAYHFLPWSLLTLTFFHPKFRTWVREHPFIRFNLLMLLVNIPVYWISVEVYPRYLLMFLPLINITGYYMLQRTLGINTKWWRVFHIVFIGFTGFFMLAIMVMPLYQGAREKSGIWLIWLTASLVLFISFMGVLKDTKKSLLWLCIALLVTRSVFDLVVLPIRKLTLHENTCREDCLRLAKEHGERKWYVMQGTQTHEVARFYTSGFTDQIINVTNHPTDTEAYFLAEAICYPGIQWIATDSLILETGQVVQLMKLIPQ